MEQEIIIKTDLQLGHVDENFEEVKKQVSQEMKAYEGLVFSDDQIKDAKSTRAQLNKLRKQIDDRRKAIKKQWNEPYQAFEKKVKEVLAIIDPPIQQLDDQITDFEARRKEEKRAAVKEMVNELISKQDDRIADILDRCKWIYDEKWENASVSIGQASKQLSDIIENIKHAISILDDGSKYAGQLIGKFEETGNLAEVLKHKRDLEERDRRYEESQQKKQMMLEKEHKAAEQEEETVPVQEEAPAPHAEVEDPQQKADADAEQPKLYTKTFTINGTYVQIAKLVEFMKSQGIEYTLVK
jgi:hypothetical protein